MGHWEGVVLPAGPTPSSASPLLNGTSTVLTGARSSQPLGGAERSTRWGQCKGQALSAGPACCLGALALPQHTPRQAHSHVTGGTLPTKGAIVAGAAAACACDGSHDPLPVHMTLLVWPPHLGHTGDCHHLAIANRNKTLSLLLLHTTCTLLQCIDTSCRKHCTPAR